MQTIELVSERRSQFDGNESVDHTNASERGCPGCGSDTLYTTTVQSGGPRGPTLLPDIGGFLRTAKFHVVSCAHCGLTRFYAEPCARQNLIHAPRWKPL